MTEPSKIPALIETDRLVDYFTRRRIDFNHYPRLELGFGKGRAQYQLFEYVLPHDECTMAAYFEWHTADFFDGPVNSHLAVGLRGPLVDDPHRGRGLALGMLSSETRGRDGQKIPLFSGCASPPGGPAMFIEEFTVNDGQREIPSWQLSEARILPALGPDSIYRVNLEVSKTAVHAAIWQRDGRQYQFLGQTDTQCHPPSAYGGRKHPCSGMHPEDSGVGNAFIGNGFAREDNQSFIAGLVLAHWPS